MSRGKSIKGKQVLHRSRQVLNTDLSKEYLAAAPKKPHPRNLGFEIPFTEEFEKHDLDSSVFAVSRTKKITEIFARNHRGLQSARAEIQLDNQALEVLAACMDQPIDYQNKTGNLEFEGISGVDGEHIYLTKFDTPYGGEYASIKIENNQDSFQYNLSEAEFNRLRQLIGQD